MTAAPALPTAWGEEEVDALDDNSLKFCVARKASAHDEKLRRTRMMTLKLAVVEEVPIHYAMKAPAAAVVQVEDQQQRQRSFLVGGQTP